MIHLKNLFQEYNHLKYTIDISKLKEKLTAEEKSEYAIIFISVVISPRNTIGKKHPSLLDRIRRQHFDKLRTGLSEGLSASLWELIQC